MAIEQYREYSKVQNRSHNTYIEPVLKMWERELDPKQNQLVARVNPGQIDAVKQRRAKEVERTTADKDLGVLKAFFSWCIDRGMAATNPVCKSSHTRLTWSTRWFWLATSASGAAICFGRNGSEWTG